MQEAALSEIHAAIPGLLPAGVAASAGAIRNAVMPLSAVETVHTRHMSPLRLREFSAGREHAKRALGKLGLPAPGLPVGPGRAPQWPAGFVGSISHAGELVLAVAAPRTLLRAVGVDVEPAEPLDGDLLRRVCRPEELARLATSPDLAERARLVFSAKESVYKCLAPESGIFLEFEDVEVLFEPGANAFRARGHGPAVELLARSALTGAFVRAGGYWMTAAWMPKSAP